MAFFKQKIKKQEPETVMLFPIDEENDITLHDCISCNENASKKFSTYLSQQLLKDKKLRPEEIKLLNQSLKENDFSQFLRRAASVKRGKNIVECFLHYLKKNCHEQTLLIFLGKRSSSGKAAIEIASQYNNKIIENLLINSMNSAIEHVTKVAEHNPIVKCNNDDEHGTSYSFN